MPGSSRSGVGASTGKVVAARLVGHDRHLRRGHQQAGDDAAEEEVADRGIGDERIDDHRDRRRDDRPDDGGHGGQRRRIARRVLAVLGHHHLHHLAGAGGIGDGRAGHAGEDDALHDVDVRKAAAEPADDGVAEAQQALGHRADVHQLRGQDEQRHGEDDVVGVHAVQELLGGRSHVEPGQQQIEDRAGDHGVPDRQAEEGKRGDRDDRDRERAGEVHTPDPALVGSNSFGALPNSACQESQR